MVIVAVAGGTGAVGRTLVKALVDSGNHKVFVISRTSTAYAPEARLQHIAVDYDDVNQIESALRENGVEAVVSALLLFDADVANSQTNLIRGAARSNTVTKFIPSEYHLDFNVPIDGIELAPRQFSLEAVEELKRHPQLTWSLVRNGLFLDYLGMPFHAKPTNMMPWSVFVDLQHEICVFPGDGKQTMVFTHSSDLAAFVERLIRIPAEEWPRESLIVANKIRLNELPQVIKKVTGRNFKVVLDSTEAIHEGRITQLPCNRDLFTHPSHGELYHLVEKEAMFTVLSNGYDLHGKNLAEIFPDVETTDIADFLAQSWALKTMSRDREQEGVAVA